MTSTRFAGGPARLGLVAVLLALVVAAGEVTASGAATGVPSTGAPRPAGAASVCPDGPVRVGVGGSGPVVLRAGADRAALAPLPVERAGVVVRHSAPVVTAAGGSAAGLAAEHVRRVDDGSTRGLLAVRCTAPTATTWFVGGATTAGETTELVLVETDGAPASVDVRGWSSTGPLDPRPGRAVPVPAGGRTALPLDRLGPDRDLLALRVVTTRGRVSAFLRHTRADGRTPQGAALVPATAAPARELVVPGLPAGPGRRTVVVTNPGARDLGVQVVLTTTDGELPPLELAVPAGTSVRADVSQQLAGTAAAARVRSPRGPVLAAALVEDGPAGGVQDLAWAGAGEALATPALLPDVAPGEQLLLSALEADAVVELVPVPEPGRPAPPGTARHEVAGGTTVAVELTGPVEVRPVSGRVHAGRYRSELDSSGPWTAALPVTGAPVPGPRPRVVADPLAGWDRTAER